MKWQYLGRKGSLFWGLNGSIDSQDYQLKYMLILVQGGGGVRKTGGGFTVDMNCFQIL